MIKKVLIAYTDSKLLLEFKGAKKDSRHMTNFMRWQTRKDIFQLLKKKEFKESARNLDDQQYFKQEFFQRLIYYPLLQNFIMEKYFPNSLDDNIRQLHGLNECDLTRWFAERQKNEKKLYSTMASDHKQAYEKEK
jgi:hypothetical protein